MTDYHKFIIFHLSWPLHCPEILIGEWDIIQYKFGTNFTTLLNSYCEVTILSTTNFPPGVKYGPGSKLLNSHHNSRRQWSTLSSKNSNRRSILPSSCSRFYFHSQEHSHTLHKTTVFFYTHLFLLQVDLLNLSLFFHNPVFSQIILTTCLLDPLLVFLPQFFTSSNLSSSSPMSSPV